jgi:hypothetical protein
LLIPAALITSADFTSPSMVSSKLLVRGTTGLLTTFEYWDLLPLSRTLLFLSFGLAAIWLTCCSMWMTSLSQLPRLASSSVCSTSYTVSLL